MDLTNGSFGVGKSIKKYLTRKSFSLLSRHYLFFQYFRQPDQTDVCICLLEIFLASNFGTTLLVWSPFAQHPFDPQLFHSILIKRHSLPNPLLCQLHSIDLAYNSCNILVNVAAAGFISEINPMVPNRSKVVIN